MRNRARVARRVLAGLAAGAGLFLAGWLARDALVPVRGDWVQAIGSAIAGTGDVGKVALGALIAALSGLAVGWMGQAESRANREAQSAARFSDRIRELAARALDAGDRDVATVAKAVGAARAHRAVKWRFPERPEILLALQELRLLVLKPQTIQALRDFEQAFLGVNALGSDYINFGEQRVPIVSWIEAQHRYFDASEDFANAMRIELGRPPTDLGRRGVSAG